MSIAVPVAIVVPVPGTIVMLDIGTPEAIERAFILSIIFALIAVSAACDFSTVSIPASAAAATRALDAAAVEVIASIFGSM